MILVMLLMCGDTGTLINPGPVNMNISNTCSLSHSNLLSCNLCSLNLLPFNNVNINGTSPLDIGSSFMNLINNGQTDLGDKKKYECFAKKGVTFYSCKC